MKLSLKCNSFYIGICRKRYSKSRNERTAQLLSTSLLVVSKRQIVPCSHLLPTAYCLKQQDSVTVLQRKELRDFREFDSLPSFRYSKTLLSLNRQICLTLLKGGSLLNKGSNKFKEEATRPYGTNWERRKRFQIERWALSCC
jgi:hypothetical protein